MGSEPQAELMASIPEPLRERVQRGWQDLMALDIPECVDWLRRNEALVLQAMAYSDFLHEQLNRHMDVLRPLITSDALERPWQRGEIAQAWEGDTAQIESEERLNQHLRDFRRRHMFRIVWRDLIGEADFEETAGATSELADVCIDGALDWLYRQACQEWGTPMGVDHETGERVAQHLVVVGMGKLGASELNLSSDIDLIFAFPASGETEGGRRSVDNQSFFTRLGQKLIKALDQPTADGFVFRVDMRLRPYGQSGALALSFNAMEEYYQNQGREWERYAMVKARVVAGDQRAGQQLMTMLRPFVYRRYIDYSAFESLREMKHMIQREVRRRSLQNNIKLGGGGIREIEFVVQAFQLIRGGRDQALQDRHLRTVLDTIGELELLPAEVVKDLDRAYVFLRNTEHALQGIADKQTQTLPDEEDERLRVARIMGYEDWAGFEADLNGHREAVSRHFSDIITSDEDEQERTAEDENWQDLWRGQLSSEAELEVLREAGFEEPETSLARLHALRTSRSVGTLQKEARRRLNEFMPVLLQELSGVESPSNTLERVLALVESVVRRSAYLLLLNENPSARRELVRLCAASPCIADQLAQTPLLLDELLNTESLYSPPEKDTLQAELRQQMLRVPLEDLEEQMEMLRHFKKAHVLRVAASEIRETLPLMKVSDYLTWIAEAVLEHVVVLAWDNLTRRYGTPTDDSGTPLEPDFAIVGYGKLGGIELGYTSDLDLVFVHDSDPQGATDGDKAIDNAVFYARLGQRVVHILNTQTPSGQLYEVDMRLRPSGNSGLLVTNLSAFRHYQENEAWTWEHQALARARWVAGSPSTGEQFQKLRHEILCRARDPKALREEVVSMRDRMRRALATQVRPGEPAEVFHIKQDPGGIVDIEFMVQYLILAWSHDYPQITDKSDNIRQMESLGEAGLLATETAEQLREIFIAMRSTIHRRALQRQNSQVAPDAFREEREYVQQCWQQIMETDT